MNRPAYRERGLTIIELMVSMAISVAVLSSLVYVYVGSRSAYRTNEALARVQETGRFAIEWIARDLRQAGYMGCLSRGAKVSIYSFPNRPAKLPFGTAVYGYENGAGFTRGAAGAPNPTTIDHVRGDVVLVSSIDTSARAYVSDDTDVDNANIKVFDNCPNFQKNEFLVVTDCQRASVFTVTNVVNPKNCPVPGEGDDNQDSTVVHAAAGDKAGFGNDLSEGKANPAIFKIEPAYRKADRAFVARFGSGPTGYFIGNNKAGRPSLYRFSGSGAGLRTEEIVENVEDLDFLFGVDSNGDGVVDAYRKADAVTSAQWDSVLSVRASLIAVSSSDTKTTGGRVTPTGQVIYLRDRTGDAVVDANDPTTDGRLRQVFSTTVALRNRLP